MEKFKQCAMCGKKIRWYHPAVKYCSECARIRKREMTYKSIIKNYLAKYGNPSEKDS